MQVHVARVVDKSNGRVACTAFSAPAIRTCAATTQTVYCLLENNSVWRISADVTASIPQKCGLPPISAISAGAGHVLFLTTDGQVLAAGDNSAGQCIGEISGPRYCAAPVRAACAALCPRKVVAIAAYGAMSAAVHSNGSVTIWGSAGSHVFHADAFPLSHQQAEVTEGERTAAEAAPTAVAAGAGAARVSLGDGCAVILDKEQQLWWWGSLPDSPHTIAPAMAPMLMPTDKWGRAPAQFNIFGSTAVLITPHGRLWAWGCVPPSIRAPFGQGSATADAQQLSDALPRSDGKEWSTGPKDWWCPHTAPVQILATAPAVRAWHAPSYDASHVEELRGAQLSSTLPAWPSATSWANYDGLYASTHLVSPWLFTGQDLAGFLGLARGVDVVASPPGDTSLPVAWQRAVLQSGALICAASGRDVAVAVVAKRGEPAQATLRASLLPAVHAHQAALSAACAALAAGQADSDSDAGHSSASQPSDDGWDVVPSGRGRGRGAAVATGGVASANTPSQLKLWPPAAQALHSTLACTHMLSGAAATALAVPAAPLLQLPTQPTAMPALDCTRGLLADLVAAQGAELSSAGPAGPAELWATVMLQDKSNCLHAARGDVVESSDSEDYDNYVGEAVDVETLVRPERGAEDGDVPSRTAELAPPDLLDELHMRIQTEQSLGEPLSELNPDELGADTELDARALCAAYNGVVRELASKSDSVAQNESYVRERLAAAVRAAAEEQAEAEKEIAYTKRLKAFEKRLGLTDAQNLRAVVATQDQSVLPAQARRDTDSRTKSAAQAGAQDAARAATRAERRAAHKEQMELAKSGVRAPGAARAATKAGRVGSRDAAKRGLVPALERGGYVEGTGTGDDEPHVPAVLQASELLLQQAAIAQSSDVSPTKLLAKARRRVAQERAKAEAHLTNAAKASEVSLHARAAGRRNRAASVDAVSAWGPTGLGHALHTQAATQAATSFAAAAVGDSTTMSGLQVLLQHIATALDTELATTVQAHAGSHDMQPLFAPAMAQVLLQGDASNVDKVICAMLPVDCNWWEPISGAAAQATASLQPDAAIGPELLLQCQDLDVMAGSDMAVDLAPLLQRVQASAAAAGVEAQVSDGASTIALSSGKPSTVQRSRAAAAELNAQFASTDARASIAAKCLAAAQPDVSIIASDREEVPFPAHAAVLCARSPVWRAVVGERSGHVRVRAPSVVRAAAVAATLRTMYLGTPRAVDIAQYGFDMAVLAHCWQLPKLAEVVDVGLSSLSMSGSEWDICLVWALSQALGLPHVSDAAAAQAAVLGLTTTLSRAFRAAINQHAPEPAVVATVSKAATVGLPTLHVTGGEDDSTEAQGAQEDAGVPPAPASLTMARLSTLSQSWVDLAEPSTSSTEWEVLDGYYGSSR